MAQSPFLTDQVQFEPGASGTRLINMGPGGELQLQDPDVSGVFLRNLVGTRSITGVFTVGRAGDGAAYASIQDALDAVPISSSASAPSVLLIYPGDYTENLVVQKDGVALYGLGDVRIVNNGVSDTIEISASLEVAPRKITFSGLKIECTNPAGSCVRLIGADSFATGSITVETTVSTPPLAAGDAITIDGSALVGIEGTRNSGSNNFNVLGSTAGAVAAEITAALNDTGNSFAAIRASIVGAVVTIDAVMAGSAGNLIALEDSTATVGALTLSGATLTGGGAAGSLVASERLLLDGCEVVASGAAAYQVRADTCGVIEVRGGTWAGSDNASLASISNCSRFRMFNVEWANDIEMAYDVALARPGDPTSVYSVGSVGRLNDVTSNFDGAGSLTVQSCPLFDTGLGQAGDQTLTVLSSSVGDLTLGDTTVATLAASSRGSVTVTAGSPTLADSLILDSVTFVSPAVSAAYAFDATQPNTSYTVALESPTTGSVLAVTNKTTLGFDVEASATFSGTVGLSIARSL